MMTFEWDKHKARSNEIKHRVSFAEASSVFFNPLSKIFDDPDHSVREHREIIIGYSKSNKLLIISFTERERIRIISARVATVKERRKYEENR